MTELQGRLNLIKGHILPAGQNLNIPGLDQSLTRIEWNSLVLSIDSLMSAISIN